MAETGDGGTSTVKIYLKTLGTIRPKSQKKSADPTLNIGLERGWQLTDYESRQGGAQTEVF